MNEAERLDNARPALSRGKIVAKLVKLIAVYAFKIEC